MAYYARPVLDFALNPRSVAVVGASDNPHKVGGRPILFLLRYKFAGAIYPVNPARAEVQGLKAYPALADLPDAPELAVIAVAGEEAMRAVEECARARRQGRGRDVLRLRRDRRGGPPRAGRTMAETAKRAGMRLIGPNCQGLANFGCGAGGELLHHLPRARGARRPGRHRQPERRQLAGDLPDGCYEKGLGVRHVHATGNEPTSPSPTWRWR